MLSPRRLPFQRRLAQRQTFSAGTRSRRTAAARSWLREARCPASTSSASRPRALRHCRIRRSFAPRSNHTFVARATGPAVDRRRRHAIATRLRLAARMLGASWNPIATLQANVPQCSGHWSIKFDGAYTQSLLAFCRRYFVACGHPQLCTCPAPITLEQPRSRFPSPRTRTHALAYVVHRPP